MNFTRSTGRYLFKKAAILLGSLLVIATLTFLLMHSIPGDPFVEDRAIPEEILQAIYKHYGLDEPLLAQYWKYLKGIVTLDFGPSFKYQGRMVREILFDSFPVSLALGFEALFLAIGGGVLLGGLAALFRQKWQDRAVMLLATLGISMPSFILASFLQYFFSMKLNFAPVGRWGSLEQTLLPTLALAALPMAFIARLTRASVVEVLQQDYIQTASSKGLSRRQILFRHAFKNALLPVLSYLGVLVANVLTGSFAVEKVFGIPGLGQWFVLSISNRDYTVIMGVTVFYGALLLLCVFLVDLAYCLLDPRIKLVKNG